MLSIIKGSDIIEVKSVVITLYGPPGGGKSTLGFSASRPLLLDFDRGAHRAVGRKDSLPIRSWACVENLANVIFVEKNLADYDTVILDTGGRALEILADDIISRNYKHGTGGSLTLQGYGELKTRFRAWLQGLRMSGKDVVIIVHSEEKSQGDETVQRLDMAGASKGEVHKSSDAIGYLSPCKDGRKLEFSPTETAFGKNPAAFETLIVPDYAQDRGFLADVIQRIKDKLNAMTSEQQEKYDILADWSTRVGDATESFEFDTFVHEAVAIEDDSIKSQVKRIVNNGATVAGFRYDTPTKLFVPLTSPE